jgi:CMP-N,N'-diacetyllegionaminic acid synthase
MSETAALGIIPARGGSKGIPGKNIRLLNGEPLIAYTIRAAQDSRALTRLILSTDSTEIAGIASGYGVEVLVRPPELAQDDTPTAPVALHALDALKARAYEYDCLVLLQPTCPLRTAGDIDESVRLLMNSAYDAVVSVYRIFDQHPARMYELHEGALIAYDERLEQWNRQELPPIYHRNGVIYAIKEKSFRKERTFMPSNKGAYVMPKLRSVNIDEESDFLFAEFLMGAAGLSK